MSTNKAPDAPLEEEPSSVEDNEGSTIKTSEKVLAEVYAKLYSQVSKTNQWKMHRDMEIKEFEKKLEEANIAVDRQKGSMHELLLEKEHLNILLGEHSEINERFETKIAQVNELCSCLKSDLKVIGHRMNRMKFYKHVHHSSDKKKVQNYIRLKSEIDGIALECEKEISALNDLIKQENGSKIELEQAYGIKMENSRIQIQSLEIHIQLKEMSLEHTLAKTTKHKKDYDELLKQKKEILKLQEDSYSKHQELNEKVESLKSVYENNFATNKVIEAIFANHKFTLNELKNDCEKSNKDVDNKLGRLDNELVALDKELRDLTNEFVQNKEFFNDFKQKFSEYEKNMISYISLKNEITKHAEIFKNLFWSVDGSSKQLLSRISKIKNDVAIKNHLIEKNNLLIGPNDNLVDGIKSIKEQLEEISVKVASLKEKNSLDQKRVHELISKKKELVGIERSFSLKREELDKLTFSSNQEILTLEVEKKISKKKDRQMERKVIRRDELCIKEEGDLKQLLKTIESKDETLQAKQDSINLLAQKIGGMEELEKRANTVESNKEQSLKKMQQLEQSYKECLPKYESIVEQLNKCTKSISLCESELKQVCGNKKGSRGGHMREMHQLFGNTLRDYKMTLSYKDKEIGVRKQNIIKLEEALKEKKRSKEAEIINGVESFVKLINGSSEDLKPTQAIDNIKSKFEFTSSEIKLIRDKDDMPKDQIATVKGMSGRKTLELLDDSMEISKENAKYDGEIPKMPMQSINFAKRQFSTPEIPATNSNSLIPLTKKARLYDKYFSLTSAETSLITPLDKSTNIIQIPKVGPKPLPPNFKRNVEIISSSSLVLPKINGNKKKILTRILITKNIPAAKSKPEPKKNDDGLDWLEFK